MNRLYIQLETAKRLRIDGVHDKELEDYIGFIYYKMGQYYHRKFFKTLGVKR